MPQGRVSIITTQPSLRHNEIRDLSEVCNNVCIEPHLHTCSQTTLAANLGRAPPRNNSSPRHCCTLDVRVFNPTTYRKHENVLMKVESNFTPLVMEAISVLPPSWLQNGLSPNPSHQRNCRQGLKAQGVSCKQQIVRLQKFVRYS